MISSLEYSEPSALEVTERNPSHQTEWKRIVTDLTSLGGVIGSPPSSPLSISWSSSGSSIDNETCVPSKQLAHHHVVTRLNFDSCVPQSTVAPHHVRAKVSRTVINCASNLLEENCRLSHEHVKKNDTNIESQGVICSTPQAESNKVSQENVEQHTPKNVAYVASQDFFCGTPMGENKPSCEHASQRVVCNINSNKSLTEQLEKDTVNDLQCHGEENKASVVCSPVSPVGKVSSQNSPIIVRNKHFHSTSCKKRPSSESKMCVSRTRTLSQELSTSPLLGTSIKKKPLKAPHISKQSRKLSPNNETDSASSASPILQHKRRRKLNFENSCGKNNEKCSSKYHLNLLENNAEIRTNLNLQVNLENINSVNQQCPAESLINESQTDKPTSPVLLPVKSKTRKKKCRRSIQICKTVKNSTNSENMEQDVLHNLNNIPRIGLKTPEKEVKERSILRDISKSNAFSPSRTEIKSEISLKGTSENMNLKQNINRVVSVETEEKTIPRKHDRRKIMHVEGIKGLVTENYQLLNNDTCEENIAILKNRVISPETQLHSSVAVDAANINEPKSNIVIENGPNTVFEESISLRNYTVDKSNLTAIGRIQQEDLKTTEEGAYTGDFETPKDITNCLCDPASSLLNESIVLPEQKNVVVTETVNSVANKQLISAPLAPLNEQQLITNDDIPSSPAFRTARELSKIKEKKIRKKDKKLPLFEVKDCIRRQINTPKPYKLTDKEEELVKFTFTKAPISTLAIMSATRCKERLKWLRGQSKNMDQSCLIEHETQENFTEEVPVQNSYHLENKMNIPDTFKETHPFNKVEAKVDVQVLEVSRDSRSIALETSDEGQEDSSLNPDLSELYIENESSQEVASVKICDTKKEDQLPSQEISEKSSSSANASPIAQHDISDCTTPTKTSTSISGKEVLPYCDSAKKRRRPRLSKDGLASRLQKLLLRQHSSTRIWQHELSRGNTHWRKTSVKLTVTSIKREYSHLLLQGMLYTSDVDEEKKLDENMTSAQLIVVLDPAYVPHLKVGSRIKIYPPWQTLSITKFDITLVLGVTCVEELPFQQKSKLIPLKAVKEELVCAANCSCLSQEPIAQRKCQFRFPLGGTEIFSHLLPHAEHVTRSLFCSTKSEPRPWHGTITDIVTRHGCLLTGSVWLQLRISKVFHYIDRISKKDVWSLLGKDNIGEYCEVILGSSLTEMDAFSCWNDVTTQHVIGHLHRFTGFTLTDRRHKSRHQDLWSVLKVVQIQLKELTGKTNSENGNSSTAAQEESGKNVDGRQDMKAVKSADTTATDKQVGEENSQLFFYVLSPCADNWEMKCVTEEIISDWPKILTSSLCDIMQQQNDGLSRHSCLVKLLYTTTENMFVTDASLGKETRPTYVTIVVRPSCFLPADVVKRKTKAVFLQDLLCEQGKLSVDKYSWVVSLEDIGIKIRCLDYEESFKSDIVKLNVTIPKLDLDSSVSHLVTVTGAVIGVDEETAFAWPVCAKCENDLLLEVSPNNYVCQQCKKQVETHQKMALEIFISCMWLPLSSNIKVKLLQESILKLLPPTENNSEGYSLIAVLGQEVGPLTCLVVSARNHNFVLEEIKLS